MARKADLQAELDILGIPYVWRDTIAQLEAKLGTVAGIADSEEAQMIAERRERQVGRRDEAGVAARNRAENEAVAASEVRTAAQQALDRAAGGEA